MKLGRKTWIGVIEILRMTILIVEETTKVEEIGTQEKLGKE